MFSIENAELMGCLVWQMSYYSKLNGWDFSKSLVVSK